LFGRVFRDIYATTVGGGGGDDDADEISTFLSLFYHTTHFGRRVSFPVVL